MAFDCVCIDFKNENSKRNIETIKSFFPYAKVIPFVKSYKEIIKTYDSKLQKYIREYNSSLFLHINSKIEQSIRRKAFNIFSQAISRTYKKLESK